MAVAVTIVKSISKAGSKRVMCNMTLGAYVNPGGLDVTNSKLGVVNLTQVRIQPKKGYTFDPVISSGKFNITAYDAAGVEVVNAVDLTAALGSVDFVAEGN
jgi:hypothetical protein